jgi:dipeptidyl aminopeptidase/acylaminoacyl peptidase
MTMIRNLNLFAIFSAALLLASTVLPAQDQETIKPTDNFIIKNIPPVPASIASEMERYTETRGAAPRSWHPKKREMIITTRFGDTYQLHYLDHPGGARKQLTFFKEPVSSADFEPLNGEYFLFTRDAGGNEFAQIYRYDMNDGRVTLLTDGGRTQNGNIVWNKAKDRIAFASTKRNGADRDIYMMDPKDPSSTKLILEVKGGGWGIMDWSPDDSKMLIAEYKSINESNVHVLDIASGELTKVSPSSKKEQVSNPGGRFSKDGNYIWTVTDKGSEFRKLARMKADGKDLKIITTDINWDVNGFDIHEDGEHMIFTANERGLNVAYLLDTKTLEYRRLDELPDGQISSVNWRQDSKEFCFTYSSARSTSDVYTHNIETGKTERWTYSELGGIVPENLSEPDLITWKSFDGTEISGFYYKANSKFTGKRPVIINIHGGPESQSRPRFLGTSNYYLNELGISIIYPNVRGSNGFGKSFLKMDNGFLRENSVKDIGALLDWIEQQPDLDASRVMVMGGSYGGYMSLACAVHYSDRLRCAVDVVGISNFNTFLKNTEDYRRDLRRVEYGDERDKKMYEYLEKISPNNNADKIKIPLFIIQGGNDPRVPRTEAEQMFDVVSKNGTAVWYLEATDEGHGFRKKPNSDFMTYTIVEFIRQNLINE